MRALRRRSRQLPNARSAASASSGRAARRRRRPAWRATAETQRRWNAADVVERRPSRAPRSCQWRDARTDARRRAPMRTRDPRAPAAASRSWRRRLARSCTHALELLGDRSAGAATRSASSENARSPEAFESVVIVRNVASGPTSVSNCAPMRASASFTSSAPRSPAPSSSMSPVSDARPGRPAGSAADPTRTRSTKVCDGHDRGARPSTARDRSGSRVLRIAGNVKALVAAGRRQPRAIDRAHCTTAGTESAQREARSARAARRSRTTRASGRKVGRAAAGRQRLRRRVRGSERDRASKKTGSPRKTLYAFSWSDLPPNPPTVCRRYTNCASACARHALQLVVGRTVRGEPARSLRRSRPRARRACGRALPSR